MGRGDLSDAEWERLRPFLPVGNGRCGRWRDHRQVIDGILHRVRTGVQWRGFGPWKTVYERHRLWSADGTWERLLQQVQAAADAGEIDWDLAVDSTIVRAHQHAADARTDPPPALASKGAAEGEQQADPPRQSLLVRLVAVVLEVRAWAARAAGSSAGGPEVGRHEGSLEGQHRSWVTVPEPAARWWWRKAKDRPSSRATSSSSETVTVAP